MNRSYLEGRKQVLQERTQPELRRPEELWSVQEKSSGLWTRSGLNGVEEGERRATNLVRELECWVPTGGGWVLTTNLATVRFVIWGDVCCSQEWIVLGCLYPFRENWEDPHP